MRFIFGGGNLVYLINEAGNLEIFASFKILFYQMESTIAETFFKLF